MFKYEYRKNINVGFIHGWRKTVNVFICYSLDLLQNEAMVRHLNTTLNHANFPVSLLPRHIVQAETWRGW